MRAFVVTMVVAGAGVAFLGVEPPESFGGQPDVDLAQVVQGNNQFALELYSQLRQAKGNLFFSPDSLSTALAMTYAGARGETAEQMARVLHFEISREALDQAYARFRADLLSAGGQPGCQLNVANRLWGQRDYQFLPEFLAITREAYGAELAPLDFAGGTEEARRTINQWVEDQTQDRIKDLIPQGAVSGLTRLVLTNAIYFKGDWIHPFPASATKPELFHLGGGKSKSVPMMTQVADLLHVRGDGYQALALPYVGGKLEMVVVLPEKADGLGALEDGLKSAKLGELVDGRRTKVRVQLPRFKMSSQFSLASTLSAMGMPLLFDEVRADLSGIATQDALHVSAVVHKAFVDVNEEGTEAAAATGVVVGVRSAMVPMEPVLFRADHPFLFLIRDKSSGRILFVGRVADPA